jgi:hypothetical protein
MKHFSIYKSHIHTIQSLSSALVTAHTNKETNTEKKSVTGEESNRRCSITDRSSVSGQLQIASLASPVSRLIIFISWIYGFRF